MEIEDLAVFMTAMRHGSLTNAAASLNMNQSTVSRRIRRLEHHLQCELLDRQLLSIGPTREGLALMRFAKTTLAAKEALVKELQHPPGPSRELNIACSTTPAEETVPQLLGRFRRQYPSIKTNLHVMDSLTVETCITERHCDVGFMGRKPRPGFVRCAVVGSDELCLVVPEGHPLAGREAVGLEAVLGLSFVERHPGSGTRALVEEMLSARGVSGPDRKIVAEVSSAHQLLRSVASGQGVGFVSRSFLPAEGVSGVKVSGLHLVRSLYVLFRPDGLRSEARALVQLALTVPGTGPLPDLADAAVPEPGVS